ncbi:hypothetical protein CARUB_v10018812mg [Capsella rubella]|uniref:Uncharacterized protein n=2 Tax=Capsella rubella TaxID=81985 RepID=R0FSR6_9BRAS|nr:hypothetical protein CARUB_v10018812mg [Capsella rubella]
MMNLVKHNKKKKRRRVDQGEKEKQRMMIRKGKSKIIDDDDEVNTDLIVKLGAFVTTREDKAPLKPYYGFHSYQVVVHTDQGDPYVTRVVKVFEGEKLEFNKELSVPLDSPARYLYMELLRVSPQNDPGTSSGTFVMGRAKIKLPASCKAIKHKASIVALTSDRCVEEKGTLKVSMKLDRYVVRP